MAQPHRQRDQTSRRHAGELADAGLGRSINSLSPPTDARPPASSGGGAGVNVWEERIARFAGGLGAAGIDAAVVNHPVGLFYLTGTAQPCNLLVVPGARPVLFARRFLPLVEAQAAVDRVVPGAGFGDIAAALPPALLARRGRLALELDVVPATLQAAALAAFPGWQVVDCGRILTRQRALKDDAEIAALRESAATFAAVHATLVEHLAPGISELELAAEVERTLRRAGCEGRVAQRRWDARLVPEGNIVSGPNLAVASGGPITISGPGLGPGYPSGASRRRLAAGDTVNIDLGLNLAGYHADIARTYVLGEPSAAALELAYAVREIEDEVLSAVRPGASARSVYEHGHEAALERGLGEFFQGHGGVHGPYIGHGLGLELDEWPVLGPREEAPLEAGMVLAIEPKLIRPGVGAANLEDDVVVVEGGCEVLPSVPRSVFAVEAGKATALTP